MRRREFITLLGGAGAWPAGARAQQEMAMRQVGVLVYFTEPDPTLNAYIEEFRNQLLTLGWRNKVQIEYRWTGGNSELIRQYPAELVALKPDLILVAGGSHVGPLQQVTRAI